MRFTTCVVAPEALKQPTLEVEGESFHHLFRVRRLAEGARLRLVDGSGSARWARVERVRRGGAAVRVGEPAPSNEGRLRLEIWVAPPRPQRAAWLIEKTTEVGVSAVRWIHTERTGREMTPARLDRLRRVAVSAVEQSHRALVPEISGPLAWPEALERLSDAESAWFLDTCGGSRMLDPMQADSAVLLIGPEGGWSEAERSGLTAAGALPVHLGPRVLRVETAAVVGAALALWRQ